MPSSVPPLSSIWQEARVVHGGADHAAAARLPLLDDARVVEVGVDAEIAVVRERLGDARLLGLVGDIEARVLHAERIEDALLLELQSDLPETTSTTRPSTSVEWL